MVSAWSYDQICHKLGRAFQERYPHRKGGDIRMVGLLFAPSGARLAREHIIPSLDYFHHRSGNNIDFFCAGYSRYGYTPGESPVSNDDPPWMFCDQVFDSLRCEIERRSRWQYSGEADLLLMNGVRDGDGGRASIDFTSAIVCDLDRMISDGAIQSVRRFFEEVFRFAENVGGDDPTWGFSDQLGGGIATSALKRAILSLLPANLRGEYCRAGHFVVRDLNARP